ncbi:MAG: type II toxin-antitoxin system Phd/YefM family antitoxin [Candidatus Omnitrophica bacterium]|jgi:prevent-host-death family protein|nr:type II toxin-antitoxin system Phd/YefM family antitoxin [Candidatus Omnitrophota bacterium]
MNMPAGKFKAKCLKLMDEVQKTQVEIIITKHGKPVAKLAPIADTWIPGKKASGYMAGTVKILGDIVGPMGVKWNADED